MVEMAESVQDHGLSAGMSELSKAKPHAVTQFRSVRRKRSGRYGATIWVPSLRCNVCLGTFGTAEEAAKAYDAAAVELQACTPAKADKKKKAAAVELHACTPGWAAKKKRAAAARPDAWTEFRGVYRTRNGKYGAQIKSSRGKGRTWLGTFDSTEDAARAYEDAAVKLHGARAVTNFKQPGEDARAVRLLGAAAETNFEQPMDLLNDFPAMPALDFLSQSFVSGAQLDDLWADLPPAERQLVDGFIKDTDFSDVAP